MSSATALLRFHIVVINLVLLAEVEFAVEDNRVRTAWAFAPGRQHEGAESFVAGRVGIHQILHAVRVMEVRAAVGRRRDGAASRSSFLPLKLAGHHVVAESNPLIFSEKACTLLPYPYPRICFTSCCSASMRWIAKNDSSSFFGLSGLRSTSSNVRLVTLISPEMPRMASLHQVSSRS